MLHNVKVAVTGSAGFVGSNLIKRLKELDADVIPIDIKNGIDITDWKQVRCIENFDLLFHLAARTYVPESYQCPRKFYYTNIIGTINILELCRIHKAKIVFISSYVYGNAKYLPIDEKHPIVAFNPYAQTKIIGEHICKGYNRDFGIPVVILRPFNIYGIGQNDKFLIPSILKQAISGKILLKDPNPKRDLIFIDDIVESYIKAGEYNQTSFEVFNIGLGVSYSVKEIAEMIVKSLNRDIEIKFSGEKRKNEVANTIADISKARRLMCWKPFIYLEEGIKRMIEKNIKIY